MAKPKGGLTAWFGKGPKGDWVDIGAPKKKGKFQSCGRKSTKGSKRKYPKCVPRATANRMSKSQIRSAVKRKRVKAEAKRKFKVYPSAYANAWLVRTYKKRGGGYRSA